MDYFFDFVSPYSYLGWKKLTALGQAGFGGRAQPILFAALLDNWGHKGPAEIPPKRAHLVKDVLREAAKLGVPLRFPPAHPFNPLAALRVAQREVAGEAQTKVIDALWDAGWGVGRSIATADEVAAVLTGAGLDGAGLVAKAHTDAAKEMLKKATEEALARGVFGVPTMLVGDELFWGSDKVDAALDYQRGVRVVDEAYVEEVLARPRAADRKGRAPGGAP